MNFKRLTSLYLIITLCFIFGFSGIARAQSKSALEVQGLRIDPFLIELNMESGQVVNQTIDLTNTTDSPLTFNISINDFVPNGNTGQPIFLDSSEASDPKYSLSNWVTVTQQPQFTIPARANTQVIFSIRVPEDAEPGTHYGGILFGQVAGKLNDSGAAVEHKAGSIILVKLGKSQEQVILDSFTTKKKLYQSGPVEFLATLNNIGNVHSKPKGDIAIKDIFGRQVTEVHVNPDALIVMPQTKRDFVQNWPVKLGIGRYTAEAVLFYGNPKIELRAITTFWILPVKELVLVMLGFLILGIIMKTAIRKYNQYIINRSRNEKE